METQIHIDIVCDEGFAADSLRRIANALENEGEEGIRQYEDAHCCAEIR